MGGSESIVHVGVCVGGKLLGECLVIGFLLGMVTDVFQQEQATISQLTDRLGHGVADALVAEGDRLADQFGKFVGHGT